MSQTIYNNNSPSTSNFLLDSWLLAKVLEWHTSSFDNVISHITSTLCKGSWLSNLNLRAQGIVVGCWSLMSWQRLRSYQGAYRLVTVHTHALLVTSYCYPIGRPGCQHDNLISHSVTLSWNLANQSLPYFNNAGYWLVLVGSDKYRFVSH